MSRLVLIMQTTHVLLCKIALYNRLPMPCKLRSMLWAQPHQLELKLQSRPPIQRRPIRTIKWLITQFMLNRCGLANARMDHSGEFSLSHAWSEKNKQLFILVKKLFRDREHTTTPLDLSVRRLSGDYPHRERSVSVSSSISSEHHKNTLDAIMEGKENLSVNSDTVTPEQIVCAPSLPGSPPLTPSPKRHSTSPRGILSASPNSMLSSHHLQQQQLMLRPLLQAPIIDKQTLEQLALNISSVVSSSVAVNPALSPNGAATAVAAAVNVKRASGNSNAAMTGAASTAMPILQPQILVKQGVSKCKECNIVFCKYENYVAHKKHYCSARNLDDPKDGKSKPSPPTSPPGNNISCVTGAYQQLICAACGIKFTSLDNLSAHQQFYCPKRVEISVQVSTVSYHSKAQLFLTLLFTHPTSR